MPTYKGIVIKSLDGEEVNEVGRWLLQPDGSAKLEAAESWVKDMVDGEQEIPEWADDDIHEEFPGEWEPGAKLTPKNGASYLKFILWAYNRGGVWAEPLFE